MSLRALANSRMGAAQTTLGDVEVPVGAERQPARIVQACREDRDHRGVVPGRQVAGRGLGASSDTEETDECDGKWRHQKPSHLAPLSQGNCEMNAGGRLGQYTPVW